MGQSIDLICVINDFLTQGKDRGADGRQTATCPGAAKNLCAQLALQCFDGLADSGRTDIEIVRGFPKCAAGSNFDDDPSLFNGHGYTLFHITAHMINAGQYFVKQLVNISSWEGKDEDEYINI